MNLLLVLAGGWLAFVLWKVITLFCARQAAGTKILCKLFVLMSNQDDAAEGFLRKLMAWRNRLWPRVEVAVVDCGANDDTRRIIRLLAWELGYPVVEGSSFCRKLKPAPAGNGGITFQYFDARKYKGRNLIRAPVFLYLREGLN